MSDPSIYDSGELTRKATVRKFRTVQDESTEFMLYTAPGSGVKLGEDVVCAEIAHTTQHSAIPGKIQNQASSAKQVKALEKKLRKDDGGWR